MGGLIARGAFTATNYNPGSIKTIITINSPHRADPVLFHRSSGKFYRIVNGFWQEELYNPEKLANSKLLYIYLLFCFLTFVRAERSADHYFSAK